MDIAFLGLGRMGRELVPHLIDAGHRVTVWNRSPEAAETIGRRGARVARTAADAVAEVDAVVSVLFGPEAVRETITEAGLPWRPGTLWIDVTTVSPADATEFAEWASAAGIRYVAAPVVGSLAPARAGTLAVLVGGEHAAARDAKRIVGLWADQEKLRTFDTPAAATAAKLVANLALAVSMETLSEALRLGRAAGLSDDDVLATLSLTAIAPLAAQKGALVTAGDFDDAQFTAEALAKDARLMLATSDVPLPAVALVAAELQRAIEAGHGDKDFSVIARDR
ncbi:NAD(P)-dependent oxidoreductase [Leifsonia sp. TF02-11]|uniref:NAD(P)-dependent oxidoreductase n=1 Tax=Leifsonia sp. TF02-11 TaxID=2815212 RepID=UPI001AA136F3|nr:NAD(P)-dependent oxidoreductase [Leifsonia sp. TF02-11]MBO1740415.1 NAD(P)-dependent oxidoreductase [Leifsonia sp. TF02-11]